MMENIIKTIRETLETIHTDVYFKRAGKNTQNPYIVFTIASNASEDVNRDDNVLSINVWGDDTSNPSVYSLADTIEETFKMKRILNDNHLLMFSKVSRLDIPDPNPMTERIELRYNIRTYKR
jgi:hypothetical protein